MTILHDHGVYRNIRVQAPNTYNMHFNINTIPGYLIYTGDMGSFVFSRMHDMFEFHRINWESDIPIIDYRYWAEKAQAVDKNGGLDDFDDDAFKECALRAFWNHEWPDNETRRRNWYSEIRQIISSHYVSSGEATRAIMDFSYRRTKNHEVGSVSWIENDAVQPFNDFYEYGPFTKPSLRLRWACWAIAHTIRDYDLGGDKFKRQEAADKLILEGSKI